MPNLEWLLLGGNGTVLEYAAWWGKPTERAAEYARLHLKPHGKITGNGFLFLKDVPALKELYLHFDFNDESLRQLEAVRNLEKLFIERCPGVTDRGLSHLARLPRLKFLALDGVNVTDAGMAHLKELKELTGFRLGSIPITDRGLAELRGLTKVTHFGLGKTQVTDAGLAALSAMPNLRSFSISNQPQITDAALPTIANIKGLTQASFSCCGVTEKGVAALRKARPEVKVRVSRN